MSRILVIALVCLLLGQALVLLTFVGTPTAPAPKEQAECKVPTPKPLPRVLLAAVDLGPGTLLNEHMVAWHPWPEEAIGETFIREGSADAARVMGSVVRMELTSGEPVTWHKVVDRTEGGALSLVLQPGMRAATVPTDAVTGSAGLIRAGDHVDLILIMMLDKDAQGNPVNASETVLDDLRVIAVNDNLRSLSTDERRRGGNEQSTVTVEVTARQASMIALALQMGRVTVSVRGLTGTAAVASNPGTPASEATATPPQPPTANTLWGSDVAPDLAPYLKVPAPLAPTTAAPPEATVSPAPDATAKAETASPKKGVLLIRGHDVQTVDIAPPEQ